MTELSKGLFVTKGMKLDIKEFSLSINDNGEIESNQITLHTGLDMCPYWLEIAFEQLLLTEKIHKNILKEKNKSNQEPLGILLQKEFSLGMQTIMAACIAIDAYYASIKEYANIPEDLSKKWRENGTARYKQIAETLKRTFSIPQNTFLQIREVLHQCFDLRDRAVHPKAGTDQPVLHPEANLISDWRYSVFRYVNAKTVVGHAISIIYQTARQNKKSRSPGLETTCDKHKNEIEPILNRWVKKHGKLFD